MKCKTCGTDGCRAHFEDGGIVDTIQSFIAPAFAQAEQTKRKGVPRMDQPTSMPPPKKEEKKYAEGGEVAQMDSEMDEQAIDNELNDMVADELMQAFESKDKKGMLDAIKAIVLSVRE